MKFRKYKVNSKFFRKWNSQMAYILGFTFADGNIYQRTLSWKLADNTFNENLLIQINKVMESTYPIEKKKNYLRLRINNLRLIRDLISLGVIPNKSKIAKFPKIPRLFIRNLIRGFLDGDGWITIKKEKMEISVGFSNGSYKFLKGLANYLRKHLLLSTSNLRKKKKLTKNKKFSISYAIEYYSNNAYKIIRYLYDSLKEDDLFLIIKYQKQLNAKKIYEDLTRGTKLWREIEDKYKLTMEELLLNLHKKESLNGKQIAKKLKVHSSSIYRWLEKSNIRIPAKRGSKLWVKRVKRQYYQSLLSK